jgi:hypothetical protein
MFQDEPAQRQVICRHAGGCEAPGCPHRRPHAPSEWCEEICPTWGIVGGDRDPCVPLRDDEDEEVF